MGGEIEEPTVIYRDTSARNIVFRDQLRRQQKKLKEKGCDVDSNNNRNYDDMSRSSPTFSISPMDSNPTSPLLIPMSSVESSPSSRDKVTISALPMLDLNHNDQFQPLLDFNMEKDAGSLTEEERAVARLFNEQKAVVKTIKHADVGDFLARFKSEADLEPKSFRTSVSLLPPGCKKMKCFGSVKQYSTGVVFALPDYCDDVFGKDVDATSVEDDDIVSSRTWCWPSGYAAKTEFNIDDYGNLINGRFEAQVKLSKLRALNESYVNDKDYVVGGRLIKGGLSEVPYNEMYVRVGGDTQAESSYKTGIHLPIALFCRSVSYREIVALLRSRARFCSSLGEQLGNIPLFFINPEKGLKVFTTELQEKFYKVMANELNPFQNLQIKHKTMMGSTSKMHLDQKHHELLELSKIRSKLTYEECASIAGGFGATDDSVAKLFMDALHDNTNSDSTCNISRLQNVVNEGLVAAVRSSDFHTSRQLLILYSLVASRNLPTREAEDDCEGHNVVSKTVDGINGIKILESTTSSPFDDNHLTTANVSTEELSSQEEKYLAQSSPLRRPPPPPLDTDRLRYATNSDGLLAVLGAAEVLKCLQDGSAKKRVEETVESIEEWISNGEQSISFRLTSWYGQRVAQGDLKIASEEMTSIGAFIGTKAISNRKAFSERLAKAIDATNFNSIRFLKAIHSIITSMHSPCLRLELLQYILGLDNRYSVAHVERSVELAATCINISLDDNEV